MRFHALALALFSTIAASCGDGDPCIKTNVVCLDRETPDNLVMEGEWTGTYEVQRHFLGTNQLRMNWYGDRYRLKVERDGVEREPFYKTTSFEGYGSLAPGQVHFRAKYSVDEIWHFYGRYVLDDQQIVLKGWIEANDTTIGDFRLARNRMCTNVLRQRENVCVDDVSAAGIVPQIVDASVAPNPVSATTALRLEAGVEPEAEWRWTVSIVPVTDPTNAFATFEAQAATFGLTTTAPTTPGEYAVRFRAEGNNEADEYEAILEVR